MPPRDRFFSLFHFLNAHKGFNSRATFAFSNRSVQVCLLFSHNVVKYKVAYAFVQTAWCFQKPSVPS